MTIQPGDRVAWKSATKGNATYYGTVSQVTSSGMIRVRFDERDGAPRGKLIFERKLRPAWVTKA